MKKLIQYTSIVALFFMIGAESYGQYCSPSASQSWTSMDQLQTSGAINNVSLGGLFGTYTDLTNSATLLARPNSQVQFNIQARYQTVGTSYYARVWIDMNDDRVFSSNELIYNGPRVSWNSSNLTMQFNVTMPPAFRLTPAGPKRIRVNIFTSSSTSPCIRTTGGSAVDFMVLFPPNSTAQVSGLASPQSPICPGTLYQDLRVTYCNDGLGRIDSVQLGGIYKTTDAGGNALPPITMPNVTIIDSLEPGDCATGKVYTHAPGFKTGDTILVWVANPNGVPDSLNVEDTVQFVIAPFVNKSRWSVGDTVGGANDFLTLTDAFHYVDSIGGICDSLIIEIDSSHDGYNAQYMIPQIAGTGPNTPIIIRGKYTNEDRALLRYDSTDADNNWIMLVNDMDYIWFDNIAFDNIDNNTTNHSHNVLINDGSSNIHFVNCSFEADYANNNRQNTLLRGDANGDNITVDDCEFEGGADAIFISGGSTHHVMNSEFNGTYLSSIHFENASNLEIAGNEIQSLSRNIYSGSSTNDMGVGIYVRKVSDDLLIHNNKVNSSNSQWPRQGINISEYNKSSGTNWVYNNMLNIGQPWSGLEYRGITVFSSSFTQVANNNIAINGNNGACEGVFYNQGTGNAFWNNVVEIQVAGVAVRHNSFGEVTKSDYNNLYAPGNNIVSIGGQGGGNFATILAYQNATSLDMNSFQLNPFYYDTKRNDLHVCNNALSKAGFPIAGITSDFDGDVRSNTPSIGADEFTPISDVRLAADYGLCPGDTTTLFAGRGNFGETAIWKSLASGNNIDTNYRVDVTMPGEYSVTFFNACGVVVDTIEIITPDAVSLPNDTNMCFGTTLIVDASITNGTNYTWSTMDSTAMVSLTTQATYSVEATDVWGCVSADTFDVTYSPAADFGIDSIIVCEGSDEGVSSNVDGTIGATFTWSGYSGAATNQDPGASIADFELPSKRAWVKVVVNHRGCISEDSVLYKVLGRPVIDIADTTNGLLFKVTANNSPGSTHSWDFGDGDTSNFRMPRHIYAADGIYTVKYTNSNQCRSKDTTFEVSVATLSLNENGNGAKVSLYPNPNIGTFTLDFSNLTANEVKVSVMDINGRTIFNENMGSINGVATQSVNLNDVAPGYYNVNITVDGNSYQEKFIVK